MNRPIYFLDVNIPMYAAGQPHALREPCAWIMEEIAAGDLYVVADAEIIQEVLYRYGALRRWDIATQMARDLLALVPLFYPVTDDDARTTIDLFEQYAPRGVTARDCLHAAVMKNNSVYSILSTDMHFEIVDGLARVDPAELYRTQVG